MRVRCAPVAALLSAILLAAQGSAQRVAPAAAAPPPTAPSQANRPAANSSTGSLDAADYASRQREMHRLWGDYQRSREQVRELARSRDAEVAERAEWILRRWEIGLRPDLPEALRRRLSAAADRPAAALRELIDAGYLREAVEMVHLQLSGPTAEETRDEITAVIASRFVNIVDAARRSDSTDGVLEMLEVAAETTPLAVARAILLDRLGETVDETNLLPQCAVGWLPERRDEVATITLTVLGRYDEAIDVARRGNRPDLLSTPLLLDSRWQELAEVSRRAIQPNLPVEATLDQHAMWLLAARQAGLDDQVRQATAAITAAKDPAGQGWRALAIAGQLDAAIELAKQTDPASAAELAATAQRVADAFAILGVDPHDPRPALDAMIDRLATAPDASAELQQQLAAPTDLLDETLAAIQLLHRIGHRDIVPQALRRVAAIPTVEGGAENARRQAILLARRLRYQELISELAVNDDQTLDAELEFYLGYWLGRGAPTFFNTVRGAVAHVRPDATPRDHFRAAVDLFASRLPDGWDRHVDLDALHAELAHPSPRSTPAVQHGLFGRNPNVRLPGWQPSYLAGDLFAGLGRSDLGLRWYEAAAESGDAASLLHFADRQLAAGNAAQAASLYGTALENLQRRASSRRGAFSEPIDVAPPSVPAAMVGQAVALRRVGQVEQSDAIWETLRLVPLNPDADATRGYIEQLGAFGETDRQREAAETALRYAAFDRSSDRHFYSQAFEHASRLQERDPAAAARWMRIGLFSSLPVANLYASTYLAIPSQWHVADALAAADGRDERKAAEQLQLALDHYPMNIEMAEEALPKIRKAGFDDVANAAIDRLFETGLEYIEHFGLDANSANNLAWVAAINGRNYERALTLSRRAVFFVPDSVSYRDTLAEILFRMGRAGEAIAIERQCLLDEPDQWHTHEQIERFSQAAGIPDRQE